MGPNKKKQTFSQFLSLRKPQDVEYFLKEYELKCIQLKVCYQKLGVKNEKKDTVPDHPNAA